MQRRYSALGFVAVLYGIAGGLIMFGSIVVGGVTLLTPYSRYGTPLISSIVGLLSGIGIMAFGERINLFRDMELNSRIAAAHAEAQTEYAQRTAHALERLVSRRQQLAGGSGQTGQAAIPPPSRR